MDNSLKEFNENGFVVVEGLFSRQAVVVFKQEIERVLAEQEKRGLLGNTKKDGVFVGLAANSKTFKEAAKNGKLVQQLKNIIGEDVVFLSDKVVFKNQKTVFASPWHQDWPYWGGSHKYSVWIALDDATVDNGCLKVIPGSHKLGVLLHAGDASDKLGFTNRLRPEDIDESKAVNVEVSAGDAIIFHDLLLHASNPNRSGNDRWALISTYKDGTQSDPDYEWAVASFPVSRP